MEDGRLVSTGHHMTLKAPAAAPFPFEVRIVTSNAGRAFELNGLDSTTGPMVMRKYELAGREQGNYLNLFEQISHTFGTRLPRNRRRRTALLLSPLPDPARQQYHA